ncbi:MAG: hypothetical protein R2787_07565 [Saprospiraceae bacterium]
MDIPIGAPHSADYYHAGEVIVQPAPANQIDHRQGVGTIDRRFQLYFGDHHPSGIARSTLALV